MHVACDRLHVELVIREVTDVIILAQIKTILFSLSRRRGPAVNIHVQLSCISICLILLFFSRPE